MDIIRNRIRLAADHTRKYDGWIDRFTASTPLVPHGRPVQFELGIFNNGVLDGLSTFTSVSLHLRTAVNGVIAAAGADLLTKTVAAAGFNSALNQAQWDSDEGNPSYHLRFDLDPSETGGLDMSGASENQKSFGLVIDAITSAGPILVGAALVTFVQDGAGAAVGTPPVATYTLSDQQILALFSGCVKYVGNEPGRGIVLANDLGVKLHIHVEPGASEPALMSPVVP